MIKSFKSSLLLFIVISSFISCTRDKLIIVNKDYKEKLQKFDSTYVSHFPDKIEVLPLTILFSLKSDYDYAQLIVFQNVYKSQLDSLKRYIESRSIAVYSAKDSTLLVVSRFTNQNNWYKTRKADPKEVENYLYNNVIKAGYPVPNFWDGPLVNPGTVCKLPEDYNLYVLEAKPGKFLPDSCLSTDAYMPKKWKHGISKGVAISAKRETVVYWLIIW